MLRAGAFVLSTGIILAVSPCAFSDDDSRYPAHHFEPSVIYQDHELIAQTGKSSFPGNSSDTHHDPKYPGSDFTPRVIYQNPEFIKN
ncbi:hypothetical protein [Methylocaldum szegediense]|uniref:Uncharacterized protein n=1 Tax=Methylocaldum szegediense TaxID=73780 RepID=A0ABN8X9E7_9GAMM|nr:hypothetical protein [Methylocaldum szegediense]CAI8956586.1 conserved exported protein of unknown function [Methylocaldum szegediense]